ncbi:hypothetical protein I4U23_008474 [Adineta vaga]|nr:hypothetical protein I4U23_008474 [Adineta vaga]
MRVYFVVILGLLCSSSEAATNVGGVLLGNTVWSNVGSANPYYLTKDLHVPRNVTLTIQAGVVINFVQGDFEILVKGNLKIEGTSLQRVTLEGGSATDLKYMLKFQSTQLALTSIRYAQFKGPKSAIQIIHSGTGLQQNSGELVVDSSTFSDGTRVSANGIYPRASFPSVPSMTFRSCSFSQTTISSGNTESEPIRMLNSNIFYGTFYPEAGNEGIEINNCTIRNITIEYGAQTQVSMFRLNASNVINATVKYGGRSWMSTNYKFIVGQSVIRDFTISIISNYEQYNPAQIIFEDSSLYNITTAYINLYYYYYSYYSTMPPSITFRNCKFTLGNLTLLMNYQEHSISIINSVLTKVNITIVSVADLTYTIPKSLIMRNVSFIDGDLRLPYHEAKIMYSNITVRSPLTINGTSTISCSSIGRSGSISQTDSVGIIAAGLILSRSTVKNFAIGLRVRPLSINSVNISESNFYSNTQYNIDSKGIYDVTATGNYWGTNNAGTIISKINDYWDNINYGEVLYNNFATSSLAAETGCEPYEEGAYNYQTTNSPYPWGK